jgi:PKD repeat protein
MRMYRYLWAGLLVLALLWFPSFGWGDDVTFPPKERIRQSGDYSYHGRNNVLDLDIGERVSTLWQYNYSGQMNSVCWWEEYSVWVDGTFYDSYYATVEDYFGSAYNDPDKTAIVRSGNIRVQRTVSIPPGNERYFKISYVVTNIGSTTYNDARFFQQVDFDIPWTYYPGGGYWNDMGWYDAQTDFIWIRDADPAWFQCGFTGSKPSARHGMDTYPTEFDDDIDGSLNNRNTYAGDTVIGLQWNIGRLAPGQSWDITVTFWFGEPTSLTADAGPDQTVRAGETVNFDASGSHCTGGEIVSYAWDFDGDGQYDDGEGVNPACVYSVAGTYIVGLEVRDNAGHVAHDQMTLTVLPVLFQEIKIIDRIPTTDIAFDPASCTEPPASITTEGADTVVKWEYGSLGVDEVKALSFDLKLYNLIPGEDRMVERELQVEYLDYHGKTQKIVLPPSSVHVYASAFPSTIDTDKDVYQANEDVLIAGTITNKGEITKTIEAVIKIEDAKGVEVTAGAPFMIPNLAPSQSYPFEYTWNTQQLIAGNYQVHLLLTEENKPVGEASAPFAIQAAAPVEGIESKIVTDKLSYSSHQAAEFTSSIKSLAANFVYSNLAVAISIIDPDAQVIPIIPENNPRVIAELLPLATNSFKSYWDTAVHKPGDYTVRQRVFYEGAMISESQAAFTIVSSAATQTALSGHIAVAPQSVISGQAATFSYEVTNIGNVDLTNVALKVILIDPDTQTVPQGYAFIEEGLSIVKGASHAQQFSANISLPPKYYMVILQGELDGKTIPLANTFLLVNLPLKGFMIKDMKIHWLCKDRFWMMGRLELPEGYQRETLAKRGRMGIEIGGKSAVDEVELKENGLIWLYQEPSQWGRQKKNTVDDSLGQGMDIKKMVIFWSPERGHGPSWDKKHPHAWFYVRGELSTQDIGAETKPAEATVTLEIPIAPAGQKGSLIGIEKIAFKAFKAFWSYHSPHPWQNWRDKWWGEDTEDKEDD